MGYLMSEYGWEGQGMYDHSSFPADSRIFSNYADVSNLVNSVSYFDFIRIS